MIKQSPQLVSLPLEQEQEDELSQNNPDPSIAMHYRMERVEKEVEQLKVQLNLYVPTRENELRLQSINASVQRIEQDIKDFKEQVKGMTTQLQEQKESQDKLVIRVLWGVVSTAIVIISGILIGYATHFLH